MTQTTARHRIHVSTCRGRARRARCLGCRGCVRAGRSRVAGARVAAAVRGHPAAAQRDRRAARRSCPDRRPRGRDGASGAHDRPRRRCGCRASTTRRSRPRSCSTGSSPRKGSPARAWAASATSSACGSSWTRPATSSPSSIGAWASRPTGAASASPWTPGRRTPCGRPSSGCTTTASPIATSSSSTGARAAGPACRTWRWSATPQTGTLWSVRYHLVRADGSPDPERTITVATTRPGDDRGRHRGGGPSRRPALPGPGRRAGASSRSWTAIVPIIADAVVEPGFGTGAVKITPAHDHADFATGRRHGLPVIDVMTDDGHMNDRGGPYAGPHPGRGAGAHPGRPGGARRPRRGARPTRWSSATASAAATSSSRASRPSGSSTSSPWPSWPWPPCARAGRGSCRRASRRRSSTGWRTSTTGTSAASCGGATESRPGTAPTATSPCRTRSRARTAAPAAGAARPSCARTRTSSTPGSRAGCGRSRRSAGRTRRTTWRASTRARSWRPATTSSSSGSPG